MIQAIRQFSQCEQGATSIEYALIALGIAGVLISQIFSTGDGLGEYYGNIKTKIDVLHEE